MFGHVWRHARVELQSCGQRAGVFAVTDDAEHEHVEYGVGFGRLTSVRGLPLHLRPVVGILQSCRVCRHRNFTSEIRHSYSITYISRWILLG